MQKKKKTKLVSDIKMIGTDLSRQNSRRRSQNPFHDSWPLDPDKDVKGGQRSKNFARGLDDDIEEAVSLERAMLLSLQQNPLWDR